MNYRLILVLFALAIACDDPSLDNGAGDNATPVTPIFNLKQLASIQLADAVSTNIVATITLSYNEFNLLTAINDSRAGAPSYTLSYNPNNSLKQVLKTQGTAVSTLEVTYENDQVLVTITAPGTTTLEKQYFTDQQNRINRMITREITSAGTRINLEDLRYNFDANFNVSTVNCINMSTGLTERSSRFTYGLNNNPFRDMNDLVRLLVFEDFIPYTRAMPASQEDFVNSNAQRLFTHSYTLDDDNFPQNREITKQEAGVRTTHFQFFNYRP